MTTFKKWLAAKFLLKVPLHKIGVAKRPRPLLSSVVTIVVVHVVSSEEVAELVSGTRIEESLVPFGSSHCLHFSRVRRTIGP